MKSRQLTRVIAASLFTLALPLQLLAQQPRYKLIDLGTLGGPNSFLSGPALQTLNSHGTFAAFGNTTTSNPNPGCFVPFNPPDCFVEQPFVLRNGGINPLQLLAGGTNSQTDWISSSGLIAGWSENGIADPMTGLAEGRAVLWTKDGQIIDLGTLTGGTESLATAINSRGQVVGFSNNDIADPFSLAGFPTQTRAFLWQNGAIKDLKTLGGPDALAAVINERGQAAGLSYTNSIPNASTGVPTLDPFLWDGSTMIDLGTLGGVSGSANWLNNRGEVVGFSDLAGDVNFHAFLWSRGALLDLHTLGGGNSEAFMVSDSGLVVGKAQFSPQSTDHHAFLWKNGVMVDLGVVDPWPCSTAYSVNSKDQVVGDTGICGQGGGPSFFSEHGQAMVDINTLVLNGTGFEVVDTFDINDRGEIAGAAVLTNGDEHAVLLVPASAKEIAAATALLAAKAATITNSSTTSTRGRLTHSQMLGAWRARLSERYHIPGLGAPRN